MEDSDDGLAGILGVGEDEGGFWEEGCSADEDDAAVVESRGIGGSSDDDLEIVFWWCAQKCGSD